MSRDSKITGTLTRSALDLMPITPIYLTAPEAPSRRNRMGRDSNPRYLAVHTLSRRAQSTALAPIQEQGKDFPASQWQFQLVSASACGFNVDQNLIRIWAVRSD